MFYEHESRDWLPPGLGDALADDDPLWNLAAMLRTMGLTMAETRVVIYLVWEMRPAEQPHPSELPGWRG